MASVIPAAFHPFAIISFAAVDVKWLYNSISQLAWSGLSFESNSFTFIFSAFFPVSSCFMISELYHLVNFFFIKTLKPLLIAKSNG